MARIEKIRVHPHPWFISFLGGGLAALFVTLLLAMPATAAEPTVHLITLDPGHFHAGLVQERMYPEVSPIVHVYAPPGPDLEEHLKRIAGFNSRIENPTHWQEKVYAGPDFLERMAQERAGNVVVISGNNARKTEYIYRAVQAGLNVLADKPMAITPAGFDLLGKAFSKAAEKKVLLYDIMTQRYEITTILQRELARRPEVFGALEHGTPAQPGVEMESVHHFFKEVAGNPLTRPAWFFDVRQQGEAIPDVGTHLVDLVQWECFPELALDWKKDITVQSARRWPTTLSPGQFKRVTGLDNYPDYLKPDVRPDGALDVFQNGEVGYTLRGVHAKVRALWRFEAPAGAQDSHYSLLRGSRAWLRIKQGPGQHYLPTLYVEQKSDAPAADFQRALRAALDALDARWPGLDLKPAGDSWEIIVPEKYGVGHEAHFAQVTERYLRFLASGQMPAWEVPGMLAKYYTTAQAYALSHAKP
jgi:predicted dehydrogenase